ncbi:MAG: hypothetical protein ACTHMY_10520 [Solirubrobacteraceae bacterium]
MRNTGATGQPVSHQTVKLARGKHASPDDGVCVMELASMLAGEEFSDHPRSVCPVIGAFLRAYNDRVDDRWRRDLWAYAAKAVGTRSTIAVERERALICRERTRQMNGQGALGEPAGPSEQPGRLRRWLQSRRRDHAGRQAALVFGRVGMGYGGVLKVDCVHRAALRFVDELIAVGGRDEQQLQELDRIAVHKEPAPATDFTHATDFGLTWRPRCPTAFTRSHPTS